MRTSEYFNICRDENGERYMTVKLRGIALLRLVLTNKGTAFPLDERRALGLDGLLPPLVKTIEQQRERCYRMYQQQPTDLAKYSYLRALQERNETLFYALLEHHIEEMLPIVYTPTVGEAVQKFSSIYQNPRGISLSPRNIDRVTEVLHNYPMEDVRMIVVTDSSAILGIGDQGYGGLAIPIGKLALYTVAGGVSPFNTMPVSLDVGTDRDDLRDDNVYLGVRDPRLTGEAYFDFVDAFVGAVQERWPEAVIQWEDLAKETAFTVLDRYRETLPSFNDDIQGTGAVALAGLISACKAKGARLRDQRIVIHGAGAGGAGVALAIRNGLMRDGLSAEDAAHRVMVLDSRGLILDDRAKIEDYKRPLALPRETVADWRFMGDAPDLLETVRESRATALLGLSGRPGAFTEEIVHAVCKNDERPAIFPMSNPTASSEAHAADVIRWSDGKALVATGSPFDPVEYNGKTYPIGQGNNAFIFPGLGFGAIVCNARKITDNMVHASAVALADYTEQHHLKNGLIYPPIDELQQASRLVTKRVIEQAQKDGVAGNLLMAEKDIDQNIDAHFFHPQYLRFVAE